jgi:Holliday junction resolvase RusA-like endonuclease
MDGGISGQPGSIAEGSDRAARGADEIGKVHLPYPAQIARNLLLTVHIPGVPVPKARARVVVRGGKARSYTPDSTAAYEEQVRRCARQVMHMLPPWIDCPLRLDIDVWLPIPASWSADRRKAASGHYHANRPDADNIAKAISDALNGIAYGDDGQIAELMIAKRYGPTPCAVVRLFSLVAG